MLPNPYLPEKFVRVYSGHETGEAGLFYAE